MIYDFDREISRRNTNSLKYDFAEEHGYPKDVLPLWVADMDFQTAPSVTDAIKRKTEHGIFGYSDAKEDYYKAVSGWFRRRFDWETQPEWLVRTPGVVFALAMAVRALTKEGDAVIIQTPVYYPFYSVVEGNNRKLVKNELLYRDGHFEMDFEDFENKVRENNVKLFILCSPHNPVGRVWTQSELERLGSICEKYGVFVVSDEIHCDFTYDEHPHTIFAQACPQLGDRIIVATAPSKTFNLAGLQASNIWIPNNAIRKRFRGEMVKCGCTGINAIGLAASQAAYEGGEEWFDQCREYIRGNLNFLRSFLKEKLPEIKPVEPEGTYFAWLDFSDTGLAGKSLDDVISKKAKLWLDAGHMFGDSAYSFQRVVLACTRRTLNEALCRLEHALHSGE